MGLFTSFLSASSSIIQQSPIFAGLPHSFAFNCGIIFNKNFHIPFNAILIAPRWIALMYPRPEINEDLRFTTFSNLSWLSRHPQVEGLCSSILYHSIFYKPPFTLMPLKKSLPFQASAPLMQRLSFLSTSHSHPMNALMYTQYGAAKEEIPAQAVQKKDVIKLAYQISFAGSLIEEAGTTLGVDVMTHVGAPLIMPWQNQPLFLGFLKGPSHQHKPVITLMGEYVEWMHYVTNYIQLPRE